MITSPCSGHLRYCMHTTYQVHACMRLLHIHVHICVHSRLCLGLFMSVCSSMYVSLDVGCVGCHYRSCPSFHRLGIRCPAHVYVHMLFGCFPSMNSLTSVLYKRFPCVLVSNLGLGRSSNAWKCQRILLAKLSLT